MASVRLSKDLEKELDYLAEQKNTSRSVIIKEALVEYMAKEKTHNNPYEVGKDYFGKRSSGEKDLSTTYKSRIKEKLGGKRSN